MTQLENSVTTVRLGKRAVPVVFFRRAAVDRRQLTGKMKSTALGIGMSGTASPRRTIENPPYQLVGRHVGLRACCGGAAG